MSSFRFVSDVSTRNIRIQNKCQTDVLLNWKKQGQSSCFSTPVVLSVHQDGVSDVFFPIGRLPVDPHKWILEIRQRYIT